MQIHDDQSDRSSQFSQSSRSSTSMLKPETTPTVNSDADRNLSMDSNENLSEVDSAEEELSEDRSPNVVDTGVKESDV